MGKFGVGVGEDFPVDEGAAAKDGGTDEKHCSEGGDRREAFRQWREQKRQWRRQMRAEWHARHHAMRKRLRREFAGDETGRDWRGQHARHLAIGALALIGLAALLGHRRHDH